MKTLGGQNRRWLALLLAGLWLTSPGCGDEEGEDVSSLGTCVTNPLSGQARDRFVAGGTFHLSALSAEGACAGQSWALLSGPSANNNALVQGEDGFARLTPIAPGEYVFGVGGEALDKITVVAASDAPFEHFNYYPTRSLAQVGDEIWVAGVYAPRIDRLDAGDLSEKGAVEVGPWPVALAWVEGMEVVLVAQRGGDTLGFVDRASGELVDAVWVGDEPSNVVVSGDGATAFVSLATEGAVAVVDVASRAVVKRVETNFDPMAMAIDDAGGKLYVATHRSAETERFPFEDDARGSDRDIVIVDTASLEVSGTIESAGSTINGLLIHGERLYVATTVSTPSASLVDLDALSFSHQIRAYELASGELAANADLSRQEGSGGFAVTLHGLAVAGDVLWAAVEGSDLVVGVDPETLEEVARGAVPGRPRAVLADGDRVLAHGAQGFVVTAIEADGEQSGQVQLVGDPRSEEIALGQAYFTGAGEGYGLNHACNSCHLDALMDGNVWKAGPFQLWAASRPFFWLEGTEPLGWEGYLPSADNFAVTVGSTISKNPDDAEAVGLAAYMTALVPPPAANGKTQRDGGMTEAAKRGEAVYNGVAGCTTCHPGGVKTNGQLFEEGATPGLTDTPSLVGAYRHGYWLKEGNARTMGEAVDVMLEWTGKTGLSAAERDDLVRYVDELTAREFFLLASTPRSDAIFKVDGDLSLVFSHPVFDQGDNLSLIRLLDASGQPVDAEVSAEGRRLSLSPAADLEPGASYQIEVGAGFVSFDGKVVTEAESVEFTTAETPALTLDGEYIWEVDFPAFDIENQTLDPNVVSQVQARFTATAAPFGATAEVIMTEELSVTPDLIVDGDTLLWPAVPLPLGGTSFAGFWPSPMTLTDTDGDGVADAGEGVSLISGPGFRQDGIAWRLARPTGSDVCEGTSGTHPITVDVDGEGVASISWDVDVLALSAYVTGPDAMLPLGPGTVSGDETYWALLANNFPTGFEGPVVYGQVPENASDNSEANGAPVGGAALEEGQCLKFSIQFSDFSTSSVTLLF